MKKPNQLREYLLNAIPDLSPDQDRLLIFTNNGSLRSTMVSGFSFEMSSRTMPVMLMSLVWCCSRGLLKISLN